MYVCVCVCGSACEGAFGRSPTPFLIPAEPLFLDMTWGAGGSTSDLTLSLCTTMRSTLHANPNMHLTCTNMPMEKIDTALRGAKDAGIKNILALRGDPPAGQEWHAVEGGFTCALDLVRHIHETHPDTFCVSVAGYPEGHPTVITPVAEGQVLSDSERSRVVVFPEGSYVCTDEVGLCVCVCVCVVRHQTHTQTHTGVQEGDGVPEEQGGCRRARDYHTDDL